MSAQRGATPLMPLRRLVRLDLLVVALLALLAAWQGVAAVGRSGASPRPAIGLLAGIAAVLAAAQAIGRRWPVGAPTVVAAAVLVVLLANPDALRGDPAAGPLGYANADAALAVQGAAAGCVALVGVGGRRRALLAALVVALTVVTFSTRSVAASVVLVPVLAVAGLHALRRGPAARPLAAAMGIAAAGCVLATALLGMTYRPAARPNSAERFAEQALTTTRVALWHDAAQLTTSHPLRGVGPERFPAQSPVARRDRDVRQAHSGYLQAAAEGGVPAIVLLLALVGAVLGRLGAERASARAAVGVAAVGALAVHASMDYVLHFPAVVLVAAGVAGLATARASQAGYSGGAAVSAEAAGKPGLTPPSP